MKKERGDSHAGKRQTDEDLHFWNGVQQEASLGLIFSVLAEESSAGKARRDFLPQPLVRQIYLSGFWRGLLNGKLFVLFENISGVGCCM